jgi:hypothetical protein
MTVNVKPLRSKFLLFLIQKSNEIKQGIQGIWGRDSNFIYKQ